MNSKCGVQSKRRCESHESCVCIFVFSACGCQKKSVVYETECRHVAVQRCRSVCVWGGGVDLSVGGGGGGGRCVLGGGGRYVCV